jgi:hypothetical protein
VGGGGAWCQRRRSLVGRGASRCRGWSPGTLSMMRRTGAVICWYLGPHLAPSPAFPTPSEPQESEGRGRRRVRGGGPRIHLDQSAVEARYSSLTVVALLISRHEAHVRAARFPLPRPRLSRFRPMGQEGRPGLGGGLFSSGALRASCCEAGSFTATGIDLGRPKC